MSTPPETSAAPTTRHVVEDATCTACGCLCDDIALRVEDGRIVEARHACPIGRAWFLNDHAPGASPLATIDGQPAEPDAALRRAVAILSGARAAVILGLTQTTNEAVAAALAIADRIGAAVDVGDPEESGPRLAAIGRVGRVSATLGEVKNRADVVVFWGADPVLTHPRHWERYSVEPRGRFVPSGRAGRMVIVVDAERTATAERADLFVRVAPGARFETLWALRALVRGVALDPARVEASTRLDPATLEDLARRLQDARYGAWFLGPRQGRGGAAEVEAALRLVRDLNATRRFVILATGGPGNAPGAESVTTWQTGFPTGVSLARGFPAAWPGVSSAAGMLSRGEADAALIVADRVETWLSDPARDHLARIPRIAIAPGATAPGRPASVALASATPGIDASGTVTRIDGVVLPLRPPLTARFPSDREWLRMIEDRMIPFRRKE